MICSLYLNGDQEAFSPSPRNSLNVVDHTISVYNFIKLKTATWLSLIESEPIHGPVPPSKEGWREGAHRGCWRDWRARMRRRGNYFLNFNRLNSLINCRREMSLIDIFNSCKWGNEINTRKHKATDIFFSKQETTLFQNSLKKLSPSNIEMFLKRDIILKNVVTLLTLFVF